MKLGRNEPCPCGSGYKYKYCCGALTPDQRRSSISLAEQSGHVPDELAESFREHLIQQREWKHRYGRGREIISSEFQGYKIVAVGSRLYYSKTWHTVHDFLLDYIKMLFEPEWGTSELGKPYDDRHILLRWYKDVCDHQKQTIVTPGVVHSAPMTGPVAAYLSLAYDLFTLAHNAELQTRLVDRMKHPDQFQGARYEAYVGSAFIRAGFDIQFEDETDSAVSHCEFVATHKASGLNFSVEAKSRHRPGILGQKGQARPWGEIEPDISNLFVKALKKKAAYERIVFLELNLPPSDVDVRDADWLSKLADTLTDLEVKSPIGEPLPPAYAVFTNHPYHYVGNDAPKPSATTLLTGFNMPHFKGKNVNALQDQPAIEALIESLIEHTEIPHKFAD